MPQFETDFSAVTTGFSGRIVSQVTDDGCTHIFLIGKEDNGPSLVLKVRLSDLHDRAQFVAGRKVRVAEVVGKMGRELMLAFPARTRFRRHA